MCFETLIGIMCLLGAVACKAIYRYLSENVYIRPKKYRIERYMK